MYTCKHGMHVCAMCTYFVHECLHLSFHFRHQSHEIAVVIHLSWLQLLVLKIADNGHGLTHMLISARQQKTTMAQTTPA